MERSPQVTWKYSYARRLHQNLVLYERLPEQTLAQQTRVATPNLYTSKTVLGLSSKETSAEKIGFPNLLK